MPGQSIGFVELLSAVSMLSYSVFGWIFAIRLLIRVRKSWALPEVSLALGYLLIAGLGYPMAAASVAAWSSLGETLAKAVLLIGSVVLHLGLAGIFVFTWRTFRPETGWARAFCFSAILLLTAGGSYYIAQLCANAGYEAVVVNFASGPMIALTTSLSALAFGWPAVESLSYYATLRRRRALGLADPIVVNRFLLWGIACTSSVIVSLVNVATALRGLSILQHQPAMLVSALLGVMISMLLILAFLPPDSYLRFIRSRWEAARG
jgi:hypothetical protein